jgi:hypothetical protein
MSTHHTVRGTAGDDVLLVSQGGVFAFGGNDVLDGGWGRDDLTGGAGEDVFVFAEFDRGFDVIRDFVPGTDKIVIDDDDMGSFASLRFIRFNYDGTPSALIRFLDEDGAVDKSMGGGVLEGLAPGDLSEEDFILGETTIPEPGAGDDMSTDDPAHHHAPEETEAPDFQLSDLIDAILIRHAHAHATLEDMAAQDEQANGADTEDVHAMHA